MTVPAASLAWLQVLAGKVEIARPGGPQTLTPAQVALLPPGFAARLGADGAAALLYGQVPQAARLDLKEIDEGIWLVSFMHYDLRSIDLEQRTLQTIDNPFGTRLSPMS